MRVIAGDVGGTKTLLRCVEETNGISYERRYDSTAYRSFDEMLRAFTADCGPVDAACFAVAGAVIGSRAELTNLGWVIDARDVERSFAIPRVLLINDFYAVALGVPLLADGELVPLQRAERDSTAPIAILGAGTGLGEAFVTFTGEVWHPIPGEGGHAEFAPQDEEQTRLLLALMKQYGHVSWERLLSGAGLLAIHEFLGGRAGDPAEVPQLASSGDGRAVRAMRMFVDIYGAEAGNMALRVLARGGVFLAGGIAAKNVEYFTDGRFVEAFTRKGRFSDLARTFPVDLVLNENVGLLGAVEAARRLKPDS